MTDFEPWSHLISTDKVIALHGEQMAKYSQTPLPIGSHSVDCVDGKLGNAWTSETYRIEEEDVRQGVSFAAFLLFYLVLGNCFPDGNKRIGWAASMIVLAELGLTVKATSDEATDFVQGIASGHVKNGLEVVQWIASRLEAPEIGDDYGQE